MACTHPEMDGCQKTGVIREARKEGDLRSTPARGGDTGAIRVTQPLSPGVFDWDVNLCQAGAFNGPLQIGLALWDHEGNFRAPLSVRTIQVDHACPPPESQLEPAESFDSTAVRLSWTAQTSGVPLGQFELQWRESLQPWSAAQSFTYTPEARQSWFLGEFGKSYDFRLRALDSNGQPEAWPACDLPETSAVLPSGCAPDSLEPDDSPGQANLLASGGSLNGNFCPAANPDWFALPLVEGEHYLVDAQSLGGGAAVRLSLYAPDANTLLFRAESPDFGESVRFHFYSPSSGTYLLKLEPLTDKLAGSAAQYQLNLSSAAIMHLPLLFR